MLEHRDTVAGHVSPASASHALGWVQSLLLRDTLDLHPAQCHAGNSTAGSESKTPNRGGTATVTSGDAHLGLAIAHSELWGTVIVF